MLRTLAIVMLASVLGSLTGCAATETVGRARADYALASRCMAETAVGQPGSAAPSTGPEATPADPAGHAACVETCGRGIAQGCFALGRVALRGDDKRPKEALVHFDRACELGEAAGCVEAALLVERGVDGPPDPTRGLRYNRIACDRGHPTGCANLGLAYQAGEVVPKDELRASQLYQRGCAGGDAAGCANLAFLFHYGIGVTRNDKRARELYEDACARGHQRACGNLAGLLVAGRGGARDEVRAAKIYRGLCDEGMLEACASLATQHEFGMGVDRDPAEAERLFTKACDGGIAEACVGLGRMFEGGLAGGKGVVDLPEASRLYRRACSATGEREACDRLERVNRAIDAQKRE
ncbi:MAG: sel1 repeat family protein [Deltaproteobacteria bacterium]|nr:sel1 repeat family protein [Deltaproteobacteria bacterium]